MSVGYMYVYVCVFLCSHRKFHKESTYTKRTEGTFYYLWVEGMWDRENFTLHFTVCFLP